MTTSFDHKWTDQLYQFADFLYWEPQHINRQRRIRGDMAAFARSMEKLRTLEVPLNRLFNITLRLAPQRIKRQILAGFNREIDLGPAIKFSYIYSRLPNENLDFIQPDTVVESGRAIVCIELKLAASLTLNQVYKYLSLLGLWQTRLDSPKTPCLLLLTQKNLRAQWDYKERDKIFSGNNYLADLEFYLHSVEPPTTYNWMSPPSNHYEQITATLRNVRLGWTTWHELGDILFAEWQGLSQVDPTDSEQMLDVLLGDFLAELEQRRLWKKTLTGSAGSNDC